MRKQELFTPRMIRKIFTNRTSKREGEAAKYRFSSASFLRLEITTSNRQWYAQTRESFELRIV
jgi:hypothetical protein